MESENMRHSSVQYSIYPHNKFFANTVQENQYDRKEVSWEVRKWAEGL